MRSGISILTGVICANLVFAAWATDMQPIIRMGTQPRELMAAKVTVADLRSSLDFYTNVVGLKQIDWPGLPKPNVDDTDSPLIEVCLNFSGSSADPFVCLLRQKGVTLGRKQAKLVWVSFKTLDARAVLNRARAAGLTVEQDLQRFQGLAVALILDPDGYTVQLIDADSVAQ